MVHGTYATNDFKYTFIIGLRKHPASFLILKIVPFEIKQGCVFKITFILVQKLYYENVSSKLTENVIRLRVPISSGIMSLGRCHR